MEENQSQLLIDGLIYGVVFIILLVTGLILFFFTTRKKFIEKELETKVAKIKHQEVVLQSIINAQEEERERIARELHDGISSKLNLISMSTHVVLGLGEYSDRQIESLNSILQLSSKTLEDSRRIAHDLLPPLLEKFGLFPALESLVEEYERHQDLHIEFKGDEFSLDTKESDLHLFRIVQELINNSIRHGKAKNIIIHTFKTSESFGLKYVDDGCGFNSKEPKFTTGIGLQNISSRTKLINAVGDFESELDNGMSYLLKGVIGKENG